jgi:hypothetical protein
MFTQIHGCRIASDEGFEVEFDVSRGEGGSVTYRETGRELYLEAGYLLLPSLIGEHTPIWIEVPNQLEWNRSHPGEWLSEDEQKRVINNIRSTFNFIKTPLHLMRANTSAT